MKLIENFTALARLVDALPDSDQALRYHLRAGRLPVEETERGRIYVRRDFALELARARDDFDRLSNAISHVSHKFNE